jgi:alkaline phosphatase D
LLGAARTIARVTPDPRWSRREFMAATGAALSSAALSQEASPADTPRLTHGPFRADTGELRFDVWARASAAGEYVLEVLDPWPETGGDRHREIALATEENDLTLHWSVPALRGEVGAYAWSIEYGGKLISWSAETWYALAPSPRNLASTIVFGSCADEGKFADQPVWDRMRELNPSLVVLLGDTPYIDSTDLETQRARYRAFYSQPQLAALLRETPFAGTWDDHDYACDNCFGAVEGRESSRRAFLEYHGPGEWGIDGQGIFTKRRVGPIEVFLLDTRWFADTEPSEFDAARKTLLGAAQWRWLRDGLAASTTPFKVLACGMVWNDAVRPGKRDFWGTWPHEREALFRFIGEAKIGGVVLASGDIHRTRVVEHATKDLAGYDILELITSPVANTVIEAASAPHPGLLFDAGVEQTFLALSTRPEAGSTVLRAEFRDGAGKVLHSLERYAFSLQAR